MSLGLLEQFPNRLRRFFGVPTGVDLETIGRETHVVRGPSDRRADRQRVNPKDGGRGPKEAEGLKSRTLFGHGYSLYGDDGRMFFEPSELPQSSYQPRRSIRLEVGFVPIEIDLGIWSVPIQ